VQFRQAAGLWIDCLINANKLFIQEYVSVVPVSAKRLSLDFLERIESAIISV
jgi:hypothetical protein